MKFGIFYEISIPRPWGPETEYQVYQNCLEQVRVADELGFDYVWAVEHHFLEEFSHCSSPELFLTACAMQTKRIRVGHGIVICVPQFNQPVRIAERAAVLDILSRGRLELGTGRSATWTELGGMDANPEETKKTWDEIVRALPKMWTQERYSHVGRAFKMPARAVLPKPYQKPHPPLWVAVSTPGTEIDAAERGLGALTLVIGRPEELEGRFKEYRRIIQTCEPVGEFVNENIATVNFLYCHKDNETGVKTGQRLADTFGYMAAQVMQTRDAFPTPTYPTGGLLAGLRDKVKADEAKSGPSADLAIGDPEHITETLKRWEAVGVDSVQFLLNMMETVPQQEVLDSLRLFAKEVMPKFADRPVAAASAGS